MKKLAVLGCTGSIGRSALALVDLHPARFQVETLAAASNVDQLHRLALRYRPSLVAAHDRNAARALRERLDGIPVAEGVEGVVEAACAEGVDAVVAGISGAAGLLPTFRALAMGKEIALANKETLVMAGELIMEKARRCGAPILPVDSEHSALHQCLRGTDVTGVKRLVLTASGGPFLRKSRDQLKHVTVAEALRHPTWEMGPKISVDSATLMNKGLEVIEAHHLFSMPGSRISIVVHPQSIVHSLVEFVDGNILAQMGITDMRSAILYALSYPEKWESRLPALDLFSMPDLQFHAPDDGQFPCIRLAYQALEQGATFPAALNAANEVAVQSFLEERIPFLAIPEIIETVLSRHAGRPADDLEAVLEADSQSRRQAEEAVAGRRV